MATSFRVGQCSSWNADTRLRRGQGSTTTWQVRIESSLVEPNELDESMPYQGRITSEWRVDGKVVEFLGNITALPQEFLDRGLAQECWAFRIEPDARWDW